MQFAAIAVDEFVKLTAAEVIFKVLLKLFVPVQLLLSGKSDVGIVGITEDT